jgi:hypothetical protein
MDAGAFLLPEFTKISSLAFEKTADLSVYVAFSRLLLIVSHSLTTSYETLHSSRHRSAIGRYSVSHAPKTMMTLRKP